MMKALAINGSHRRGRNTAKMLKMVRDELEKGGFKTELLEERSSQGRARFP
jgi:multimeric flavodoxin WrbA